MELPKNPVAYFCAEFAIDSNMPTYAGGLGVLAGDTMLEAAQMGLPMVGIGLLYEGKHFIQKISDEGWQTEEPSLFHKVNTQCVRRVEIGGTPLVIKCNFAGEDIHIGAYQQRLGDNTTLYFLTTNMDENPDWWRSLMDAEYWGGDEEQLRQQLVLGIGGMKLLSALKIKPSVYHFNEGRPIFAHWEILAELSGNTGSFDEAMSKAKEKIVYTNHTLVAAGNKTYDQGLVLKYANDYTAMLSVDTYRLIEPGIDKDGKFSITLYALKVSRAAAAVSKLHGKLSKKQWPDYKWFTITNAVHMGRWQADPFKDSQITNHRLWEEHLRYKRLLEREVVERTKVGFDPNRLVVGWARRISDYKQLGLLFGDIKRLKKLVSRDGRQVQILIAGKAHPGDDIAKSHIQNVVRYMQNELFGFAVFVHNYDLDLAFKLLSGCDVWLNTPEYGKEASGTSGMKALSNGVLNATVADGWANEVDWADVGWVIDHTKPAESLYSLLEDEIVPLYYERNDEDLPEKWLSMMHESITLAKQYSTERLLRDYLYKVYST